MGAVLDALRKLRERAQKVASTRQKLLRPAAGDNSAAGRRIVPAPSQDKLIGLRIDRGMQIGNKIKIYVQPNKDADDRMIKKMANENSHQKIAEAEVDVTDPVDDKTLDKVFNALEEDAKRKGFR